MQDDGTGPTYDLPAPSKSGILPPVSPAQNARDKKAEQEAVDDDSRWSRVGRAPRFGSGDDEDDDGTTMLDHSTWLEGKLEDRFYGGE